jgi:hypothetical protein
MISFVTLHRGRTLAEAELIGVATDPTLVAYVAAAVLHDIHEAPGDAAMVALSRGRRRALRVVQQEAERGRTSIGRSQS